MNIKIMLQICLRNCNIEVTELDVGRVMGHQFGYSVG